MQAHRIGGVIGKDGRFRREFVYLAQADSPGGGILVKVGMARDPYKRVCGLKTGCPFPIKGFSYVEIGSTLATRDVETLIHKVFMPCRSSGEWFLFDLADPEHKRIWTGGLPAVLNAKLGKGKWILNHYDMKASAEVLAEQRTLSYQAMEARKKRDRSRAKILREERALEKKMQQFRLRDEIRRMEQRETKIPPGPDQ